VDGGDKSAVAPGSGVLRAGGHSLLITASEPRASDYARDLRAPGVAVVVRGWLTLTAAPSQPPAGRCRGEEPSPWAAQPTMGAFKGSWGLEIEQVRRYHDAVG
jgi:hypothetical protein